MKPTLHHADVLQYAAAYTGEPYHALLCDPPYHLTSITHRFGTGDQSDQWMERHKGDVFGRQTRGFMGKQWDGGDLAFRAETWAAFLPLLHPGAFGFAFSGTRGCHRMMVAIEDAGFIIHPVLIWSFGQGFPKSTRIDNQIDDAMARQYGGWCECDDDESTR
jgi:site-specific DNA-methyltransferase (adenine-specific)